MLKRVFLVSTLVGCLVPVAVAQLNARDKAFVTKAAKANNYEIKAAQMVSTMSSQDSYKTYAQMVIDDHTKAGQDLTSAVSGADSSMQLPTGISAVQQQHLDTLKNAGKAFDVKYRDQMISTHVAAIKLFQNYVAQPNDNPQIKQFAQSAIPVFRKHLVEAKKLPSQ